MGQIHKFIFNGVKLVLDVASGALHVVDEVAWEVLDLLEKEKGREEIVRQLSPRFGQQTVLETLEEIEKLRAEGQLWSEDILAGRYQPEENQPVKALCLNIAHDCNLRCRYCFAGTGAFGGKRKLMPASTARQAVDFLLAASGPRRHVEIDFFGGEPLLNWEVLRETVEYGLERAREAGKKIKFTVTTNGTLLDEEKQEFLNQYNMSVVLSIDGREEVNDRMRRYPDGRGTYRELLPRYLRFVNSRRQKDYYLRGTYTAANLDFYADAAALVEAGFKEISLEPVVGEGEYALTLEHLPAIRESYENLARYYVERWRAGEEFTFFHFLLDLTGGPCLPKRLTGCGAGYAYLAVDPEGGLYPCHQFVGHEEFCLGTVAEGITRPELSRRFLQAHVYNKEECRCCWARFLCSGGCHAHAYREKGDIMQPASLACAITRLRLEAALYVQAVRGGLC